MRPIDMIRNGQSGWCSKNLEARIMASRPACPRAIGCEGAVGDAFAVPAGKLLAHVLDNFPAARLAFERGGHDLAELAQPRPAAFAASARRWPSSGSANSSVTFAAVVPRLETATVSQRTQGGSTSCLSRPLVAAHVLGAENNQCRSRRLAAFL